MRTTIDELDVYRTAAWLIKSKGNAAAMECAELADRSDRHGEQGVGELWRRVMWAIQELQSVRH